MNKAFGLELLVDAYGVSKEFCDDLSYCYDFLEKMAAHLGMSTQSPPFIFRSDHERFPDKRGLSGWVPLIESSIVIHTLTDKGFISIDLYSCREFDRADAVRYVQEYFRPESVDTVFVERGKSYHVKD